MILLILKTSTLCCTSHQCQHQDSPKRFTHCLQWFVFQQWITWFWDTLLLYILLLIIQTNSFRGGLTDVSATTQTLIGTSTCIIKGWMTVLACRHCWDHQWQEQRRKASWHFFLVSLPKTQATALFISAFYQDPEQQHQCFLSQHWIEHFLDTLIQKRIL